MPEGGDSEIIDGVVWITINGFKIPLADLVEEVVDEYQHSTSKQQEKKFQDIEAELEQE